ncbi:MAG: fluoride efflux transporter CrcB [Candidatus Aminicenantales bacterium]
MFVKLAVLAAAGALGTLARYGLTGVIHKLKGTAFPWGTLAVNLIGCLIAGFIWTLFEGRKPVDAETRTLILVGFMGAFTTFSAFILDTGHLIRAADWTSAAANISVQNVVGIVALFAGMALGRLF